MVPHLFALGSVVQDGAGFDPFRAMMMPGGPMLPPEFMMGGMMGMGGPMIPMAPRPPPGPPPPTAKAVDESKGTPGHSPVTGFLPTTHLRSEGTTASMRTIQTQLKPAIMHGSETSKNLSCHCLDQEGILKLVELTEAWFATLSQGYECSSIIACRNVQEACHADFGFDIQRTPARHPSEVAFTDRIKALCMILGVGPKRRDSIQPDATEAAIASIQTGEAFQGNAYSDSLEVAI